ncbi:M50 family metallopeptidase [Pseudarthrobacter sp. NamB4]|uniref:M50 family metallopeptidase n=1 Tax=Pseudarthrobacter sp. NamB4 TaxID=2576837 RepID=UPI0010FE0DE8|nr:M50 family metallopeptidase [Pseudarthrobacter sp. NamB4]TLM73111.1 M50 family metallopeptidase [Pseudarthrobacter sp. NamB4]
MTLPGDLWDKLSDAFARADAPGVTFTELVVTLVIAAGLSVPRRSWRYFGLLATATHEMGHAVAAVLSGQRLSGIRLRLDHSGTTTTYSHSRLASAWSCFWGYPVPSIVGATFVWCGFSGWGPAAIAGGALALAASLLFLRNLAGILITSAAIACTLLLVLLVPEAFLGHVAVILGLALLVAAVRDLMKLAHVHLRRRERLAGSDAYLLWRATAVPSAVWIVLFAALVAGSWLWAWQPISAVLSRGA